jgi:hypothetical protein
MTHPGVELEEVLDIDVRYIKATALMQRKVVEPP